MFDYFARKLQMSSTETQHASMSYMLAREMHFKQFPSNMFLMIFTAAGKSPAFPEQVASCPVPSSTVMAFGGDLRILKPAMVIYIYTHTLDRTWTLGLLYNIL